MERRRRKEREESKKKRNKERGEEERVYKYAGEKLSRSFLSLEAHLQEQSDFTVELEPAETRTSIIQLLQLLSSPGCSGYYERFLSHYKC